MAAKKQQTHAKRARELAVKERRERKRARKAEAAAQRELAGAPAANGASGLPEVEGQSENLEPEWVR
jgi:hypothetical protein